MPFFFFFFFVFFFFFCCLLFFFFFVFFLCFCVCFFNNRWPVNEKLPFHRFSIFSMSCLRNCTVPTSDSFTAINAFDNCLPNASVIETIASGETPNPSPMQSKY